jgi:hypothetical protein
MNEDHAKRDLLASACAVLLTAMHFLANLSVFVWYYWIAPRWKRAINDLALDASRPAKLVLQQSDFIVNYWYLLVVFVLPALVFDFLLMRWLATRLGLTKTLAVGIAIAALLLLQAVWSHYVLSTELTRLRGMSAASGL